MTAIASPVRPLADANSLPRPQYWAGHAASEEQLAAWVEQFNRDGCLFIPRVLTPAMVAELRADLDRALAEQQDGGSGVIELRCRMFETSRANLRLFDLEPIVTFAERAVAPDCHVIHNNGFRTPIGKGITGWHQDDQPHYRVTHGEPPTNVMLPCLLFTANYYLTDVDTVAHGPTQVVPGSHLLGASPPSGGFVGADATNALSGTRFEAMVRSCLGPAGSVVIFNNQVWHRGAPNASDRVRYMAQVSYARRLVGHKYFSFMNYQMPAHVYEGANPRLKRLLGFLPSGAYG